ncbi:MAG TPA: DUF5666 domain-containing protein, partial [Vicinamibacterales bacterium]
EVSGLSGRCPTLRFTAAGVVVTTNEDTRFQGGGLQCGELRNGMDVRVRGVGQPNGTVLAERVQRR